MRVLVIGAGNAGEHLAERLTELNHEVVVVDVGGEPLAEMEERLDVLTVQGQGASPRVLDEAEIEKTDLLVAVTNRDEVNILSCVYANACGVPHKVARVSSTDYTLPSSRLDLKELGVDLVICHKEESAREMYNILRRPGTLEVIDLLDGRMVAVGLKVSPSSPLAGVTMLDLHERMLVEEMRFISVIRGEELVVPRGETSVRAGDDIYAVVQSEKLDAFLEWAYPDRTQYGKVIIAGGGDLGLRLAQFLESTPKEVVLIEHSAERADYCSGILNRALVLKGDTLDTATLENAGMVDGTAFVAVTGSDEDNIIGCLLAQKMGASFTVAQVTNLQYAPVINGLHVIDRLVSPQLSMVNAILHFARGQNVKAATLLHKLPGELLEISVPDNNKWAGKAIKELRIPRKTIIAAVMRGGDVYTPTGDLVLHAGDSLVVFALPEAVGKLRSLVEG